MIPTSKTRHTLRALGVKQKPEPMPDERCVIGPDVSYEPVYKLVSIEPAHSYYFIKSTWNPQ